MGRGEVRIRVCLNQDAVAHASMGWLCQIGGRKYGKSENDVKGISTEMISI